MRSEILNRSTAQTTIAGLHVTITAAIAGIIVNNAAYRDLRLVLPFVSPVLGLLYLDHHETIARLSCHIEAYYRALSLPTYQGQSIVQRGKIDYLLLYLLPTFIFYAAAPAAMLAWAYGSSPAQLSVSAESRLWIAGVCFVTCYTVIAFRVLLAKPHAEEITPRLWTPPPPE